MKRTIAMKSEPTTCPYCAAVHNALSGDALPSTGDVSICFSCTRASVLVVAAGAVSLRKPITADERERCQGALRSITGGG